MSLPSTLSTKLILLRHGQTNWNVERRYQGQTDTPLNDTGRQQARQAGHEIKRHYSPIEAIYSSDLSRALETARIVGQVIGLQPQTDARLREMHLGEWEGQLLDTVKETYPEAVSRYRTDPIHHGPPGGELAEQVRQRFFAALDEFAARHAGQRLLVVTHGLPVRLVQLKAEGKPLTDMWQQGAHNATPYPHTWPLDAKAT